mgnify:CR=1 FL=1
MEEIMLTFPGTPIPLSRPRFGRHGKVYTPSKCQEAKRRIAIRALAAMNKKNPISTAVDVEFVFYMPQPKKPKLHQRNGCAHLSRPDLTNLIKLVEDALNGIVWTDDCIIARIDAQKKYGTETKTVVVVRPLASVQKIT